MAKLLITTQVYENYGAHDWDGEGACPQYWKAKGGNDYVIKDFRGGDEAATAMVMAVRERIEESSDYYQETIIGWELVEDSYLTDFERSQLEYEGEIKYPAHELTV
jgi:hypothetical protein